MRKLRTNAGDKSSSNAKEVKLAIVHNTKYCIPLDHPILRDHGVFYPMGLSHPLRFEIKLPPVSEIVVGDYSDPKESPNYTITNLELQYECIKSEYLANKAKSAYQTGKGFYYENIHLYKNFKISKANDGEINEHINVPRRSLTGVLCLFTEAYAAGARDSEKFTNPDITSIKIDIDGVPNQVYSSGMVPSDFWDSIKKRLNGSVTETDFYADKFALWIDLQTFSSSEIHGSGFKLNSTRDGIRLGIKRNTVGTGNITCYMFVVADALMEVKGSNLESIL